MQNVVEYLERSGANYPDKLAFSGEDCSLTFGELLCRAKALGTYIRQQTGLTNAPIGITIDRTVSSIVAMQGVLMSGNFYVPVDIKMPPKRAAHLAECIELLIFTEDNRDFAATMDVPSLNLEEGLLCPVDSALLQEAREQILDVDPVYMIFTSGSTGTPKGIVVSHRSVMDFTGWLTRFCNYTSEDVFGNQAPFYFDLSVKDVYQTLSLGATCHIFSKKLFTFPLLLLKEMEKCQITAINWATSAFHFVASSKALSRCQPTTLRTVTIGGEALQAKWVNVWQEALPQLHVINLYGPTEVTVDCTGYHLDRTFGDNEVIPIGKACQNKQILLLSPENTLVSRGETGELCVRGCGLAKGYYNDPEKTAAAFVQNPLQPHYPNLLYRTGDLAYENENGEYVFVSRFDGQIKHMGYRIELSEIETALHSLDGINNAVCLFHPERDKIIAVYEGALEQSDIATALRHLLPKYMLPNHYHKLDTLPLNPNGKVDRVALRTQYVTDSDN